MLFIGWFPNLVVMPDRIKKSIANIRMEKGIFSFLCRKAEVPVSNIVISPRIGIRVFRAEMAFCICSMNVGADKPFGLYPSHIPKMAPATKETIKTLKNRIVPLIILFALLGLHLLKKFIRL